VAQKRTRGKSTKTDAKKKRTYVPQSDVPRYSVKEALRVPEALANEYGKQPTHPDDVATAMGMKASTGKFQVLTGTSIAYGFTEGGAQADEIALTDLGLRVVAPTVEDDDIQAMREGLMRPRATAPSSHLDRSL
jgi:hypothetical protein